MDVTLERVQFKFASIIGELCSKPLILSQFAVWVDLRLAEYKLKGSISLDCSGDKPDPEWLKGVKSLSYSQELQDPLSPELYRRGIGSPGSRVRRRNHDANPRSIDTSDISMVSQSRLHSADISDSQTVELRDSPDIIIKQEPTSERQEVFPVGLHVHESSGFSERKRSRISSGVDRGDSQSPLKMRKVSDTSFTPQESSNQSLMSIIGGQDSIPEASPISLEDMQRDLDLAVTVQMQESHHMGDNSTVVPYLHGRLSSHASSTVTKSASSVDPNIVKHGNWSLRPKPGRVLPHMAKEFGMVELLEGSGVYLDAPLLTSALDLCTNGLRQGKRLHSDYRDGQPAARFLLSVFFSKEEIANGTLSQGAEQNGVEVLDPLIINVITDFCLKNSDSKSTHIKQALYRKISSFRFKQKQKESSGQACSSARPDLLLQDFS